MLYVLDASFVGTLIIPDEKNINVEKMYTQIVTNDEKWVPSIFSYEMVNIFMNLLRRKRNTYDESVRLISVLFDIRLKYDHETGVEYSKKLLRICNDFNISSYDAAYLELAERKNAVLCTMDDALRAADERYGVRVLR